MNIETVKGKTTTVITKAGTIINEQNLGED